MKKEIGKIVLAQERISGKGFKIETSEKKSEKGPRSISEKRIQDQQSEN